MFDVMQQSMKSRSFQFRALQVISVIVTLLVFVNFIPWLMAHPVEDLSLYSDSPSPPKSAQTFSVNHGTFTFYDDSPSSNKLKACLIIGFLGTNCGFQVWAKFRMKRARG